VVSKKANVIVTDIDRKRLYVISIEEQNGGFKQGFIVRKCEEQGVAGEIDVYVGVFGYIPMGF
jgi:hypothetical protein